MTPDTAQQIEFVVLVSPYCRIADMGAALGKSVRSTQRKMQRAGASVRPRSTQPLSREAVIEAYKRLQFGVVIGPNLHYWAQESGTRYANQHKLWTLGDDEVLREQVGRKSMLDIARLLKRTTRAIKARLWLLGIRRQAVQYTCGELARSLHVSQWTVNSYCHAGLLRSWLEGHWRIVHADDAEWLLSNYRYYSTCWESIRGEVKA
jgi:hypothetical protein